jgi:hypothetical protein
MIQPIPGYSASARVLSDLLFHPREDRLSYERKFRRAVEFFLKVRLSIIPPFREQIDFQGGHITTPIGRGTSK